MVNIKVNTLVSSCVTNRDGDVINTVIRKAMANSDQITLDFFGISTVSTSFVNSAIVDLLSDYDVETVKGRLSIRRASKQIGNMIKMRVSSETEMQKTG